MTRTSVKYTLHMLTAVDEQYKGILELRHHLSWGLTKCLNQTIAVPEVTNFAAQTFGAVSYLLEVVQYAVWRCSRVF